MGALVSALFPARHPERVARLVLTGPALPGLPDPPRFAWAWRLALGLTPRLARIPIRARPPLEGSADGAAGATTRPILSWPSPGPHGDQCLPHLPSLLSMIEGEIERYRLPWRIDGAIQAAVLALAALTVDEATSGSRLPC